MLQATIGLVRSSSASSAAHSREACSHLFRVWSSVWVTHSATSVIADTFLFKAEVPPGDEYNAHACLLCAFVSASTCACEPA